MLAVFVHSMDPYVFQIGNFGVKWYGVAYVLGFICAYFLYQYLARKGLSELKEAQVGDFIAGAALFGVLLGGRLGYFLFYKTSELWTQPLEIFKIWGGGMSSHGGMIGLFLYTLYYSKRHKVSWFNIGDNLCVVAPIGIFFGRIANFINGELWGHPTEVSWGVIFPEALPSGIPRHPSQIYEALLEGLFLFTVLWFVRTKIRTPNGALTGLFFFVYGVVRIFCETFREPDLGDPLLAGLSRGQWLSCGLLVMGTAFLVVAYKWKPMPSKAN